MAQAQISVKIAGTAATPSGSIQAVQYRMSDSHPFQNVVPDSVDDHTWHWHQDVTGLRRGPHIIQIQAFDNIRPDIITTDLTPPWALRQEAS